MAAGSFNSLGSAYDRCPVSENQRRHEARQRQEREQIRTTAWIAATLAGQTFASRERLIEAARIAAVALQRRSLSPEQHTRIVRAATVLWVGVAQTAHLRGVRYTMTPDGQLVLRPAQERVA